MKLVAKNIACQRGGRVIFSGLSFSLSAGQSLLLRGPNGAGKTTLLRALAGFMPLSAGHFRLEDGGTDKDAQAEAARELSEQCHYIGHRNGIKPAFTAWENLTFWQAYLGAGNGDSAIAEALESFGLSALRDVPAGLMSQGQKRRLGLARLLLARRPVWILDEPTVSLDTSSQKVLASHIAGHAAQGGIVLAATHIPLGLDFTFRLDLMPGDAEAGEPQT